MKIAYIAGFAWEPKGTVRSRIFPLAAEMTRRGHEASIFIVPYDNPKYSGMEYAREGVQIFNLEVPRSLSPAHAAIPRKLVSRVTESAPDVIHVFKPKGFAGMAATKLLRASIPVVLDCDDWEGWGGWNEVKNYPWVVKEFIDRQEKSLLRKAPVLTCASRVLTDRALQTRRHPSDVFYLPNGISSQQLQLAENLLKVPLADRKKALGFDGDPVILYAGHFGADEDTEFFCRAICKVSSHGRMTVALVGGGPDLAGLENRLKHAGARVRAFGELRYEEYSSVVAASDIAAFPYRDTPVYRAKCSARMIDFMLYGKAIVTSAVGENNHYITHEESGLLVPHDDLSMFEHSLGRLLDERNLREKLGNNARQRALQKFLWSRDLGNQCELAYRRVLDKSFSAQAAANPICA
jgi:glycosyltransferase involved in cell wall biosynthesis